MRCPRCGNENPETHRFCGMCGASLLQASASPTTASAAGSTGAIPAIAAAPTASATQVATRKAEPVAAEVTISGPSFLGLNQAPPPPPRKRASLSIDPHSAPNTSNLDYLLEEEEPKSGGTWKFVVMVLALLLAVGLGYLRWRNHGFSGLKAETDKPAASQSGDATGSAAAQPATSGSTPSAPAQDPPQGPVASAPAAASQPGPDASSTPSSGPSAATPATAPPAPVPGNSTASPAPGPAADGGGAADNMPKTASAEPSSAVKNSNTDTSPDQPAVPVETPKPAPPVTRKPTPAIKRAPPVDPVAEAQRYLYGKGAAQDCERGMRILKPAAEQSNSKAMVEMGALYSAGLCTPRDLPTAYRWFALALRKEPDNSAIQTDLTKLWGEMTQPERQLAIRLSQ